jgi:peptidase YpeB-like protein
MTRARGCGEDGHVLVVSCSERVQGERVSVSAMLRHLVILAGALSVFAAPALADGPASSAQPAGYASLQDRYTAPEARDARRQGDVVPALRVISEVRRRYPGADVLDAELEGGAQPRYVIKILTRDGRRVDVVADARTGQILYER